MSQVKRWFFWIFDTAFLFWAGFRPVKTEYGRRWKKVEGHKTLTLGRASAFRHIAENGRGGAEK